MQLIFWKLQMGLRDCVITSYAQKANKLQMILIFSTSLDFYWNSLKDLFDFISLETVDV